MALPLPFAPEDLHPLPQQPSRTRGITLHFPASFVRSKAYRQDSL